MPVLPVFSRFAERTFYGLGTRAIAALMLD
jgi:hypothetical protein